MTNSWQCALSLDKNRRPGSGSTEELARAIRAGADLRVGTAFRHNEHIDPASENDELIREVMDFRITYLLEDRWVAGIENLRMPVALPDGFGPRESMSFFLYYYTKQQLFMASANPVVRTKPLIPLGYGSCVWDFGWLMPRTDGHVSRWLCEPHTLKFRRDSKRYAIRWYVSE